MFTFHTWSGDKDLKNQDFCVTHYMLEFSYVNCLYQEKTKKKSPKDVTWMSPIFGVTKYWELKSVLGDCWHFYYLLQPLNQIDWIPPIFSCVLCSSFGFSSVKLQDVLLNGGCSAKCSQVPQLPWILLPVGWETRLCSMRKAPHGEFSLFTYFPFTSA